MTALGARRGGQHLDFLVVADRLDIHAGEARKLADRYADTVIVLRDGEKVLDRRAQAETITDIALALRG